MKKGFALAVLLVVIAAGVYWFARQPAPQPAKSPATTAEAGPSTAKPRPENRPAQAEQPAAKQARPNTESKTAKAEPPPAPEPKGFCERDFGDVTAREADAAELQAQGGVVHIFEREAQLADPYGCADFYLAHGLDVDAVDARPQHPPLTGLLFAIQRNDPKMVRFMLEHGADLKKRAGAKDLKPLGYAYNLALNDTRINRNAVIGILDGALTRQAGDDN